MGIEHRIETPLAQAVCIVGSQSAFARLIGKTQGSVFGWLRDGKHLPAEHVLKVEAATGISRHDLRPDIYPIEETNPSPGIRPGAASGEADHVASPDGTGPDGTGPHGKQELAA